MLTGVVHACLGVTGLALRPFDPLLDELPWADLFPLGVLPSLVAGVAFLPELPPRTASSSTGELSGMHSSPDEVSSSSITLSL